MTISEILQRIRMQANDDGTVHKFNDSYYITLMLSAIEMLESHMGKMAIRDNSYQFIPMRDSEGAIDYEDDGVTPTIDTELFYDPDTADTNSPSNIFVNKGLTVKTGETTGTIQTADYLDVYAAQLREPDIAFIKIDADVVTDDTNTVAFDVSFDNRETWLVADYGYTLTLLSSTTDYVDVSRIPSKYISLKWTLTGSTAKVRNTTFWRYYLPKDVLRHYSSDVLELAQMKLIEIRLDYAIKHQNDPMVISSMQGQINNIRRKYGLDRSSGDTKPLSQGYGIQPYPANREEQKIFGTGTTSADLFADGKIVSITNTGQVRRV